MQAAYINERIMQFAGALEDSEGAAPDHPVYAATQVHWTTVHQLTLTMHSRLVLSHVAPVTRLIVLTRHDSHSKRGAVWNKYHGSRQCCLFVVRIAHQLQHEQRKFVTANCQSRPALAGTGLLCSY